MLEERSTNSQPALLTVAGNSSSGPNVRSRGTRRKACSGGIVMGWFCLFRKHRHSICVGARRWQL